MLQANYTTAEEKVILECEITIKCYFLFSELIHYVEHMGEAFKEKNLDLILVLPPFAGQRLVRFNYFTVTQS